MILRALFMLSSLCILTKGYSQADEWKVKNVVGASLVSSYTAEGFSYSFLVDWSRKNHSFYAGPKLMAKRTYNPKKGIYGGNIGYKRKYLSGKFVSCFLNLDFQGRLCRFHDLRALYRMEDVVNPKINYVVEAFIGNSILFKVFDKVNVGNTIGVGGYVDSNYSYARIRKTNVGKNILVSVFLNYTF